jgi:anhydro-N-acetylmuramic acid kinase
MQRRSIERIELLAFYRQKHPKSLGFEFVKELYDQSGTAIEQIKCKTHWLCKSALPVKNGKCYLLAEVHIMFFNRHDSELLPEINQYSRQQCIEFKETSFGLLGVLKYVTVNTSSVTGAKHDHSSE